MPRAGLSTERVVEQAERLVDTPGSPPLTLAVLAESLGVRQPSLYKHIEGMDGLQRELAVRAKTELADTLARAAVGRARADALRAIAHAYRGWALAHPVRYAATVRAPAPGDAEDEAASTAAVTVVFAALAGYGLLGDDAVDATRALRAALHGFISLEAGGGFGLPVSIDASFERLVEMLVGALDAASAQAAS